MASGLGGFLGNLFGMFSGMGTPEIDTSKITTDVVGNNAFNMDSMPTNLGSTVNNTGQSNFLTNQNVAKPVFDAGIKSGDFIKMDTDLMGKPTSFLGDNSSVQNIMGNKNLIGGNDVKTGKINGAGSTQDGGLGFNMDTLMKLGLLGGSLWNDAANRKLQKGIANHNIEKDKNAQRRTKSVQASLDGRGDPHKDPTVKEYEYV